MAEPDGGEVRLGHKVELGIYTQDVVDQLETTRSVFEELQTVEGQWVESRLRSLLGCFLFTGDSVFKAVGVLSGGEKSRLTVAKLLLQKANFLVLDEPTNHLDVKAKDVLQKALSQFEGTVLIVSHDRYFLDRVVDQVYELRQGVLHRHLGNYSSFLEAREKIEREAREEGQAQETKKAPKARSKEARKKATEEKIRRNRILREYQTEVEDVESKIGKVESRVGAIEEEMSLEEVYSDAERLKDLSREHGELKKQLQDLYEAWEKAQAALEEAREKLEQGVQ